MIASWVGASAPQGATLGLHGLIVVEAFHLKGLSSAYFHPSAMLQGALSTRGRRCHFFQLDGPKDGISGLNGNVLDSFWKGSPAQGSLSYTCSHTHVHICRHIQRALPCAHECGPEVCAPPPVPHHSLTTYQLHQYIRF